MNPLRLHRGAAVALLIASVGLAGCGSDPPEERLAEIEEKFEEAAREAKMAHRDLERLRERMDAQEERLVEARRELARAQGELVETAEKADERVTDVALFRSIHERMLEEEMLQPVAIRVSVEDRVVTLRGEVDREAQAERALEIARDAFGVAEVRDRLTVRGAGEDASS